MLVFSAMLNNLRRVVFAVVAGALLAAPPALADWEADLQVKPMKSRSGESMQEMKGKAYGRNGMVRMDLETPRGAMSMIIDREKHTVVNLMHAQKMAMQMDTSRSDVNLPSCDKKDFDKCLVEQGYKKTGSEKANGHPCDIYEKDQKLGNGGTMHVKVWRPTDLKETVVMRSQSTDASGSMNEVNLTNVKVKALPDSLFTVPPGYQRMQSPGVPGAGSRGGSPGPIDPSEFQGKSPEEIQELIKKRLGQQ